MKVVLALSITRFCFHLNVQAKVFIQSVCLHLTYLKTSGKTAQPYSKTKVRKKTDPKIWICFRRVFVVLGRELETCAGSYLNVQVLSLAILGRGRSKENTGVVYHKIKT